MRKRIVTGLLAGGLAAITTTAAGAAEGTTERVSVATGGAQARGNSFGPSISADGRLIAFRSLASNLVPRDTNGEPDILVRDLRTGRTERVSVATGGAQADGASLEPSLSADGRFVAFLSEATNLVPGDTNVTQDAFVRDRRTGQTERVSLRADGTQADSYSYSPSISADGRFVAFDGYGSGFTPSDTAEAADAVVRDRRAGRTEVASVLVGGAESGGGFSTRISANGRFVAFSSYERNLAPGDTGDDSDVFVRDRQADRTERVSVGLGGAEGRGESTGILSLSADGRFVAFVSDAANLVAGDTNGRVDVFVRDRQAGTTERVNLPTGAGEANGTSGSPSISADGRFIAFVSDATNLVPSDTNGAADVFVRDRRTGRTERASVRSGGVQANGRSYQPSISADGGRVAFGSYATNLVPGDTNRRSDVFVRTR